MISRRNFIMSWYLHRDNYIYGIYIVSLSMVNKIDNSERQKLLKFAYTKPNYREQLFELLWAKNFTQKFLSTLWIKKVTFTTTTELFSELIISNMPRSYDAQWQDHNNKIQQLESEYEKFIAFSHQFDDSNLAHKDNADLFKIFREDNKEITKHAMKRTLEQLQIYPIPLIDVFDIIGLILDIGKQKWFSPNGKSYVMQNFINNKIPALYMKGLENPEQRSALVDLIKNRYGEILIANDVMNISLLSEK